MRVAALIFCHAGVCIAATRKLEQELGISPKEVPPNQFQYLSKIHYLAPSNEPWGEHESEWPVQIEINCTELNIVFRSPLIVDYILFITAFVKVNPNPIEIRDYKYVTKEELQAMFDDPRTHIVPAHRPSPLADLLVIFRELLHALVQAHCARFPVRLVGRPHGDLPGRPKISRGSPTYQRAEAPRTDCRETQRHYRHDQDSCCPEDHVALSRLRLDCRC